MKSDASPFGSSPFSASPRPRVPASPRPRVSASAFSIARPSTRPTRSARAASTWRYGTRAGTDSGVESKIPGSVSSRAWKSNAGSGSPRATTRMD